MSKLVKSTKRPSCAVALEQGGGVWLTSDDATAPAATVLDLTAATLPHPEGGGRRMLRQVPAGVVLIEVVNAKPVGVVLEATAVQAEEPIEEPVEGEVVPRVR